MLTRLRDRLKFEIERLILRSPISRLLVIALAIVTISVTAGVAVYELTDQFTRWPDAVWWAFLRLTDPGYLGDDEGRILRTISTVLTILGYVVFLGALIAIMTQWLHATMNRLQQGLTPIVQSDHVVILGWTNRTATIIEELLLSEERVRRFLRLHGTRSLRIAVLVEDLGPAILQELSDRIGRKWNYRQTMFRSGTPLRLEHLDRVDFMNAAAILLPFPDFSHDNTFARDERTIKVLLSIDSAARQKKREERPLVVVEILDGRNASLASRAYTGPIEVLASDLIVSRLIAQNVRHAGLSVVYSELLTHSEGNEIYVRDASAFAGKSFAEMRDSFPRAVLIGLLRKRGTDFDPLLDPEPHVCAEAGDRFVVIARDYAASAPARKSTPRVHRFELRTPPPLTTQPVRRILLLGWNHKVPALVAEFGTYRDQRFELDVVSVVSADERELRFRRHGVDLSRCGVQHIEADFTSVSELRALEPSKYDNVVILASEWKESEIESDARTILGFLILEEVLAAGTRRPEVLVELMDQENVPLLRGRADVLISPLVLSHMLTQVALRRELRVVFDEMFGPEGVEIFLRPVTDFIPAGEARFADVADRVFAAGDIAIGFRAAGAALVLNPERETVYPIAAGDEVVVLTRGVARA